MKFSPTFLFKITEVYDPLIRNFGVWALDKRIWIFFLANSGQSVRHLARGQNMEISTVDV